MLSTHGFALQETAGGRVNVAPGIAAELAAAAVSPDQVLIQKNGKTIVAPIDKIDPNTVELACDDTGCVLIADDGNSRNDINLGFEHHEKNIP